MDEDYSEIDPDIESVAELHEELDLKKPEQKKEFVFWYNTLTIIGGLFIASTIIISIIIISFYVL